MTIYKSPSLKKNPISPDLIKEKEKKENSRSGMPGVLLAIALQALAVMVTFLSLKL